MIVTYYQYKVLFASNTYFVHILEDYEHKENISKD